MSVGVEIKHPGNSDPYGNWSKPAAKTTNSGQPLPLSHLPSVSFLRSDLRRPCKGSLQPIYTKAGGLGHMPLSIVWCWCVRFSDVCTLSSKLLLSITLLLQCEAGVVSETSNPVTLDVREMVSILCLFCIDSGFCNAQLSGDALWVYLRPDKMGSNSCWIVEASYYL